MRHFFCAGFFGYIFIEPQGIISPAAATYFAYSYSAKHPRLGAFVAFESPYSERNPGQDPSMGVSQGSIWAALYFPIRDAK